ncbi:hypothetical protein ACP4OV_009433 [Aristida adscensionis]
MEASLSSLRQRLGAAVLCWFGAHGGGGGGLGLGERVRWGRRAGAGDFRYDPLSYALNFDEGVGDGDDEEEARAGLLCRSFAAPAPAVEVA